MKYEGYLRVILLLLVVTLVSHILVISNMGFYSHDEWERYDHVLKYGFIDFFNSYMKVVPGQEFGMPVRPVGFLEQGLTSFYMYEFPVLPHLIDTLLHYLCSVLFYFNLLRFSVTPLLALVSALCFVVSPLSISATAWVGASFDNWLLIFTLLSFSFVNLYYQSKRVAYIFFSILSCCLAILSKESALVLIFLPIYVWAIIKIYLNQDVDVKSVIQLQLIIFIPFIFYLYIRFPALQNSFSGISNASYTPSLKNIFENTLLYLEYPFAINIGEINVLKAISPIWKIFYLGTHILLILLIMRFFGLIKTIIYVLSYFIFLLPVISISSLGAHYLTLSSIPLALAISSLLTKTYKSYRLYFMLTSFLLALLTTHFLYIGYTFYLDGRCQRIFLDSLTTALSLNRYDEVFIYPDELSPVHVAQRAIFGREIYQRVKIVTNDSNKNTIYMDRYCVLYR